jgi:hypothetical protein
MIAWLHTRLPPVALGTPTAGTSTWQLPPDPAVALALAGKPTPYTIVTQQGARTLHAHSAEESAPLMGKTTHSTLELYFHSVDFIADCIHKALDAWQDQAPDMRRPNVAPIQSTWTMAALRCGLVVGQGQAFQRSLAPNPGAVRLGDWFVEAPAPRLHAGWRQAEVAFVFTVDGAQDSAHQRLAIERSRQEDLALLTGWWGHNEVTMLVQPG